MNKLEKSFSCCGDDDNSGYGDVVRMIKVVVILMMH